MPAEAGMGLIRATPRFPRSRDYLPAVVLPPERRAQTPAGSAMKEDLSPSLVACPAQEWAPAAQSFLPAFATPKHFSLPVMSGSLVCATAPAATASAPNRAEAAAIV